MTITLKAFFRSITAAFTDPAPATAAAGILMLFLVLYTGYPIPLPSMISALRWITYINVSHLFLIALYPGLMFRPWQPLKYGFEALMVNEFSTLNAECETLIPTGPGYENITLTNQGCAVVGSQPGHATVEGLAYLKDSYGFVAGHLWRVSRYTHMDRRTGSHLVTELRHPLRVRRLLRLPPRGPDGVQQRLFWPVGRHPLQGRLQGG